MFDSISPLFWILLSISFGSARHLAVRSLVKNQKDTTALLAFDKTISVILLLSIIFLFSNVDNSILDFSNVPTIGWLSISASAILYSAASFLIFRANRTIEAAERAILNQLTVLLVLLLSSLVLSEVLTPYLLAGAVLIMLGATICTYRKTSPRWGVEGVKLIILSCILIASANMFDKISSNYFSPFLLSIPYVFLTAAVSISIMNKNTIARAKKIWDTHNYSVLFFAPLSVFSFLFYYFALSNSPLSEIYPLKASQTILTTIAAIIFLGENKGIKYKIIGAILAIIGVILIHG